MLAVSAAMALAEFFGRGADARFVAAVASRCAPAPVRAGATAATAAYDCYRTLAAAR